MAVAGCGSNVASPPAPPVKVVQEPDRAFPTPDYVRSSTLAILTEDGKRLKVGDKASAFDTAFPKPPKASSLRDLPQGFPSSYMVRGWERDTGGEGAGALIYENRLAVAMRQVEGADEGELTEVLHQYEAAFGPGSVISGTSVRYWFWEVAPHRLMINAFETGGARRRITIALGDGEVLSELGVSPEFAKKDRETLQRLLLPGTP